MFCVPVMLVSGGEREVQLGEAEGGYKVQKGETEGANKVPQGESEGVLKVEAKGEVQVGEHDP